SAHIAAQSSKSASVWPRSVSRSVSSAGISVVELMHRRRAGDSLELEASHRSRFRRRCVGELLADEQALAELAVESLDARRQVHRRADAGEVEAREAADVAVGDVAEV